MAGMGQPHWCARYHWWTKSIKATTSVAPVAGVSLTDIVRFIGMGDCIDEYEASFCSYVGPLMETKLQERAVGRVQAVAMRHRLSPFAEGTAVGSMGSGDLAAQNTLASSVADAGHCVAGPDDFLGIGRSPLRNTLSIIHSPAPT